MKIFQGIIFLSIYFSLILPFKCLLALILSIGFIVAELCPAIYIWSKGLAWDVNTNGFANIWEMEIDYFKVRIEEYKKWPK